MVPISPEIYSSTAVVMDNRSLADYIQKLEDRRAKRAAAEQEAFDAWNEANEKSLNPSKMRNQELGKFNEGLQEYRALAIEAKRNPKDYTKRLTAQKKADELLALARASSNAKEIDKEYTTLLRNTLNNPEARKTTDYQRILQDKAMHDLPIGWKAGGLMGVPELRRPEDTAPKMDYYKPPPIDVVQLFDKNSSGVKLGAGVRTSPTDKDFFYTETATYTPEGIKSIAERVADKVANDPNLLSSYRVKGQQLTPDQAAQMTATLKKYFPDMEVDDDNPISVALADIVIEGERRKEEKKVRDVGAYARYQSGLIASRGGGGTQGEGFIDYWAEIKSKPTQIIGNLNNPKQRVQGIPLKDLTATPQKRVIDIANSITGEKFEQGDLILQELPDGKIHILQVLYGKEKDKAGNFYPIGVKDIVPIEPEDINLKPQIDIKSRRKAVEEAKKEKQKSPTFRGNIPAGGF